MSGPHAGTGRTTVAIVFGTEGEPDRRAVRRGRRIRRVSGGSRSSWMTRQARTGLRRRPCAWAVSSMITLGWVGVWMSRSSIAELVGTTRLGCRHRSCGTRERGAPELREPAVAFPLPIQVGVLSRRGITEARSRTGGCPAYQPAKRPSSHGLPSRQTPRRGAPTSAAWATSRNAYLHTKGRRRPLPSVPSRRRPQ